MTAKFKIFHDFFMGGHVEIWFLFSSAMTISQIFWCMEICQWPSLILTHTGIKICQTAKVWNVIWNLTSSFVWFWRKKEHLVFKIDFNKIMFLSEHKLGHYCLFLIKFDETSKHDILYLLRRTCCPLYLYYLQPNCFDSI